MGKGRVLHIAHSGGALITYLAAQHHLTERYRRRFPALYLVVLTASFKLSCSIEGGLGTAECPTGVVLRLIALLWTEVPPNTQDGRVNSGLSRERSALGFKSPCMF